MTRFIRASETRVLNLAHVVDAEWTADGKLALWTIAPGYAHDETGELDGPLIVVLDGSEAKVIWSALCELCVA